MNLAAAVTYTLSLHDALPICYYEPPRVYQYDVYISETNLYDMAKNQLVWAGTVETTAPDDINKEIQSYVHTVIDALKSRSEEHTSELQSLRHLVCRLLLEKKK